MRDENVKYYASCSFGKDSLATILLALEHGDPLDAAVFCEVMFDNRRGISGEDPDHIAWINDVAIPKLASLGVPTIVLRSEKDYVQLFYHVNSKGKSIGKLRGFPIAGKCVVNRELKSGFIHKWLKSQGPVIQYLGIAADEPERLARLGDGKISLMAKYGYTEAMARDLCERNGLLSPLYAISSRGGCWFCLNMRISEASWRRKKYPLLWNELQHFASVPNLVTNKFDRNGTLDDLERRIDAYDAKRAGELTLF